MALIETKIEKDQLKWSSAADYAAVLHLNRQYLRGEIMTTPYDHRLIDHDTAPDPNLLRLTDYGFFIYGWQSGRHIGPMYAQGGKPINGSLTDNGKSHFYELQKRECLHFLTPLDLFKHEALHVFWLSVIRHDAIVTRIVCGRHSKPLPGGGESPHVAVSSNLGQEPYPIVRRRAASTMEGLKDAVYETFACAPPDPDIMDHSKWNFDAVTSTLPQEFFVATKQWGGMIRIGVLIENLAVAAGLKMVYAEGLAGGRGLGFP